MKDTIREGQRAGEVRYIKRDGQRILQEKWVTVTWPHEPYREKGEEVITETWKDVPTVEE